MSAGRKAIRERRALLVERAAIERDELAGALGAWRRPLAAAERVQSMVRGLKRGAPALGIGLGVGAAALAFVRPGSVGEWFRRGQAVWQVIASRGRTAAKRSDRIVESDAESLPK